MIVIVKKMTTEKEGLNLGNLRRGRNSEGLKDTSYANSQIGNL